MPLQTARNETYMSYSKSIGNRDKHILPDWQAQNEILDRNETVSNTTPSSFARGRLQSLIENKDTLPPAELKILNAAQTKAAEQKAQQEKADRMAKLTPCMQLIVELEEQLSKQDQSERPPFIRDMIAKFMANKEHYTTDSATKLYTLARTYEYHKKPKKRAKDQKVELAELAAAFQIKVN